MPTIGEALGSLEEELFVGRGRHLAEFRQCLLAETSLPSILDVSGHGGVGKSALLRTFARTARQLG